MKKVLLGLGALAVALAVVPMFAAFEAHVVNVTATIENALQVPIKAIQFGTVFPQEHLEQPLDISLSRSFLTEDRVDDVRYFIRQKPKCAWSWWDAGVNYIDENSTATGHVVPNGQGGYTVDCGNPQKPQGVPESATWGMLPSLCQYVSKDGGDPDGLSQENDGTLTSFHQPFTIVGTSTIQWNDVGGYLAKSIEDIVDVWTIDLAVPCFGGYCAQDWADFVHSHNPEADPNAYTQPIDNEHKVFGCDLWVEVAGVSEFED